LGGSDLVAITSFLTDKTDPGTPLEKFQLAAGEATVVHELITDCAPGPPAAQHGLVTVQAFFADLAEPGLDPEQHRLPISACPSDAHQAKYSEALRENTSCGKHRRGKHLAERRSRSDMIQLTIVPIAVKNAGQFHYLGLFVNRIDDSILALGDSKPY
jgi:hypothetical protein